MIDLIALSLILCVQEPPAGPMREIEDLRRETEFLRDLNRLELTRDQLSTVIKAVEAGAKKADEIAAAAKPDLDALAAALTKIRDALAKGQEIDPEDERGVGEAQQAVGELMQDLDRAQQKVAADVKAALNEKQWTRLQSLGRPDPVRMLRENFSRLVGHAREEPDLDPFEPIHEHLRHMAKPLGLSEDDVRAEAERIAKIADEAAVDPDFESKKDDYLRRAFDEGKLADALKKTAPPAEDAGRRLGQMLAAPRTIKAMKLRLENMK